MIRVLGGPHTSDVNRIKVSIFINLLFKKHTDDKRQTFARKIRNNNSIKFIIRVFEAKKNVTQLV